MEVKKTKTVRVLVCVFGRKEGRKLRLWHAKLGDAVGW